MICIAVVLFFVYILVGLYLYLHQTDYIYFPDSQDFDSCPGFEDAEKAYFNGTRMYYKPGNGPLIVYYHDNTGSACDSYFLKPVYEKAGYSYIIVEYAGYSNDLREPSKRLIDQDVRNVVAFVNTLDYESLVLGGYSLGTGPATYHSTLAQADKLYLVAPYSSIKDVAMLKYYVYPLGLILHENYNNEDKIGQFNGSLLILHGDKDTRIPPRLSKKVFDAATTKEKKYQIIEGAEHANIHDFNKTLETIYDFLVE